MTKTEIRNSWKERVIRFSEKRALPRPVGFCSPVVPKGPVPTHLLATLQARPWGVK